MSIHARAAAIAALAVVACSAPLTGDAKDQSAADTDDHRPTNDTTSPPSSTDAPPAADTRSIAERVDPASIQSLLQQIAGERWSPAGKQRFRDWFRAHAKTLGMDVEESSFHIQDSEAVLSIGETEGHNIDAVLPGTSKDTLVLITHYDTVGITGHERENPGVDDAGSGLAMILEAARIFAAIPNRRYTVRFAAADLEEVTDLEGDDAYVAWLQHEAKAQGFRILAAADDDQVGWSCWKEKGCSPGAPAANSIFQLIACSGDARHYDYPDFTKAMKDVLVETKSPLHLDTSCDGSGDTDHYSFWKAGIPAYVVEEYDADRNPHYDDTGDDTFAHLDLDYLTSIARVNIALQAKLAGIGE
jgi:Zn-dependent M28 family amino/carboxypeptidase